MKGCLGTWGYGPFQPSSSYGHQRGMRFWAFISLDCQLCDSEGMWGGVACTERGSNPPHPAPHRAAEAGLFGDTIFQYSFVCLLHLPAFPSSHYPEVSRANSGGGSRHRAWDKPKALDAAASWVCPLGRQRARHQPQPCAFF